MNPYRRTLKKYQQIIIERINDCRTKLRFASPDKTSLLCVGCGCGEILMEQLLPLLPLTINRIVGTDTNAELVHRAQYFYNSASHRVTFRHMNLNCEDFQVTEMFDHVVSLWDVRWLNYESIYLSNMAKMVKDNGIILVIYEYRNSLFNTMMQFANQPLWHPYLYNIEYSMTPYHIDLKPPVLSVLVIDRKFVLYEREERKTFLYENFAELIDFLEEAFSMSSRMPQEDVRNQFYTALYHNVTSNNRIEEQIFISSLVLHKRTTKGAKILFTSE